KKRELPLQPDAWHLIDRDADTRGCQGIYDESIRTGYWDSLTATQIPGFKTIGTDMNSTTIAGNPPAPDKIVAVGGKTSYNGNNPPKYINALFDFVQIKIKTATGSTDWVDVENNESYPIDPNQAVPVRVSIRNNGDAKWISPIGRPPDTPGMVYL